MAQAVEHGLITMISRRSVPDTIDVLVKGLNTQGLEIFARIDHAANAVAAGLALRPTELLIFGSARTGTVLMQENQSVGVDLPLKALAHEDENGEVWLTFPDPNWLAERYGLAESATTVKAMERLLIALVTEAAGS